MDGMRLRAGAAALVALGAACAPPEPDMPMDDAVTAPDVTPLVSPSPLPFDFLSILTSLM